MSDLLVYYRFRAGYPIFWSITDFSFMLYIFHFHQSNESIKKKGANSVLQWTEYTQLFADSNLIWACFYLDHWTKFTWIAWWNHWTENTHYVIDHLECPPGTETFRYWFTARLTTRTWWIEKWFLTTCLTLSLFFLLKCLYQVREGSGLQWHVLITLSTMTCCNYFVYNDMF